MIVYCSYSFATPFTLSPVIEYPRGKRINKRAFPSNCSQWTYTLHCIEVEAPSPGIYTPAWIKVTNDVEGLLSRRWNEGIRSLCSRIELWWRCRSDTVSAWRLTGVIGKRRNDQCWTLVPDSISPLHISLRVICIIGISETNPSHIIWRHSPHTPCVTSCDTATADRST